MKKLSMMLGIAALTIWAGTATAAAERLEGTITKISGDMITLKMSDGKTKSVHVDPIKTRKQGELKVGAMVKADVNADGHADSIEVNESAGSSAAPEGGAGSSPAPDTGGSISGGPSGENSGSQSGTMP